MLPEKKQKGKTKTQSESKQSNLNRSVKKNSTLEKNLSSAAAKQTTTENDVKNETTVIAKKSSVNAVSSALLRKENFLDVDHKPTSQHKREPHKLKVIPLGGLGEIGKNMTVIEYEDEILVIDAGLMFPEDDMLGIDLVIPDITYLLENREKIQAIVLTHGHEDHIGALPYVLRQIDDVPVYGTPLTIGILQGRMKENNLSCEQLHSVMHGETIKLGAFHVCFIRVNHSIPDAAGLAIRTPIGLIVHTGDFKLDYTPVDGMMTDFRRFSEVGNKGVLLMMADSTNAERPGHTPSERTVGFAFDKVFHRATHRIIVATFSSNVHRIQQVIDTAVRYKRKVAVLGRSMINVVNISLSLGYIHAPEGTLIDIDDIKNYLASQIVIITTGSQGEPMSALTRMATCEHRKVSIMPEDTIIISATPIPGNEKLVSRTIDYLLKHGADVVYGRSEGIHVSGHASQEELKLMHNLVRPKFFMPVHGEYRHLVCHARLAHDLGMPKENIFIAENGSVLEFTRETGSIVGKVTAGRILIDGLGVGDVGNIVLRDRHQLSQDGIIIIVMGIQRVTGELTAGPDIVSRGFVYVRESEALMDEIRQTILTAIDECQKNKIRDWSTLKTAIRDVLGKYLYEKTRRRPMILPIIMEV